MSRLLTRSVWDLRLQFRNGIYYAAAGVVVFLGAALVWLPPSLLGRVLPLALFTNVVTNGFYFMAALVLFEKGEQSLAAQVVTPLRAWEYLAAKLATLSLLSLLESTAIVAVTHGAGIDWPVLLVGVAFLTWTLGSFGFLLVARYDSINEFLFPSFLLTTALSLPLLDLLDSWSSPLWYLHPAHASLVLIRSGFEPFVGAELYAAASLAVAWAALAFFACVQGFHRFVSAAPARS